MVTINLPSEISLELIPEIVVFMNDVTLEAHSPGFLVLCHLYFPFTEIQVLFTFTTRSFSTFSQLRFLDAKVALFRRGITTLLYLISAFCDVCVYYSRVFFIYFFLNIKF